MNQKEFAHQVARATGENLRTVSLLGFVPLTRKPDESEPWLDSVLEEIAARPEQRQVRWKRIRDTPPA